MDSFEQLIHDMKEHSLEEYPNECVGIITKDFKYKRCNNISENPEWYFILDPKDLIKYDDNIWGIFHSHPGDDDPIPSEEDKISAAFNTYKFLVGYNDRIVIYWVDKILDVLRFEIFERKHIEN